MDALGERTLKVGSGAFDPLSGELSIDGRSVKLRPRTAALLGHLVLHGDRVVTKAELMSAVWPDVVVTEDSIVQCVKEVRQALGPAGREWIRTVPRQGYAFVGNGPEAAPASERPRSWKQLAAFGIGALAMAGVLTLPAWRDPPAPPPPVARSFVVLPVVNLTGDPAREDSADELTESLADLLGRSLRATVIASGTALTFKGQPVDVRRLGSELNVQYVLQGALRPNGKEPVLVLRLADTATTAQLWSGEFALEAKGLTPVQPHILQGVASAVGMQLIRVEAQRSGEPAQIEAAELLSRARAIIRWSNGRQQPMQQARALLEQAVQQNPRLATAWGWLAATHLHEVRFSPIREAQLQRAAEAVARGLALAPEDDGLRLLEGNVQYEQGRMAQALRAFERACELNPNNVGALGWRGAALVMQGRAAEALPSIAQAIRLSPRDPQLTAWLLFTGVAHLHLGNDAQAVDWLARGVASAPDSAFGRLFLAGALGSANRVEEARAQVAELQRLRPGFTLARFRAVEPSREPGFVQQRQRLYEGLRRAGLPE